MVQFASSTEPLRKSTADLEEGVAIQRRDLPKPFKSFQNLSISLLASVNQGRQMVQVRRTIEGCSRQVLHLKAKDLVSELQKGGSGANRKAI